MTMQEASIPGFVRIILWILAFYYIFKFLARLFLPVVVKKVSDKAEEHFRQQYQNKQQAAPNAQANRTSDKPRETKKVGDYIDYEEIP